MNLNQTQYLKFDTTIYLTNGQEEYLFSRGFIDSSLHLVRQTQQQIVPECEFRMQQKNYLREERKTSKSQSIVFGTEIFIRHMFSNQYLCIEIGEDGNEVLCLRERPNEECYFEILPQRTFEHKGDFVTYQSTFAIRHSKYKCYIGCNLQTEPLRRKIQQKFKSSRVTHSYRTLRKKESLVSFEEIEDANNSVLHQDPNWFQDIQKREELLPETPEIRRGETSVICMTSIQQEQEVPNTKDFFLPLSTASVRRQQLKNCVIEKHVHTMWHVDVKEGGKHSFLCDNDYVYFISSKKDKGLMNINDKTKKTEFIRNQGDNQYVCSALFIVQMVNKDTIYLKHLLTGKYFPFNELNHKKKLRLVPLLPLSSTENKMPPFHLYFEGEFYPKEMMDDQHTCGFWLNKVNKLEINEILSLEGISHQRWIAYLLKYLDSNRKRRQQILSQFGFINFLMQSVIPYQNAREQTYQLLFKMINMNEGIRREMIEYITQILQEDRKESIIDILSEMLDNEDNLSEKYINAHQLEYVLKEFLREDLYQITFMRIFRLFCGHESQTCQRNQNAIFNLFIAESSESSNSNSNRRMVSSILKIQKHELPSKFKCKISINKQNILFLIGGESFPFSDIPYQQQEFIRQYFYLMGDCLKLNKDNIKLFMSDNGQAYSLENLLYILESAQLERLRGPILNLINAVYLEPEYRYKLYVFLPEYENMCYNGSLVALNQSETIDRLISYILKEIEVIRTLNEEIENLLSLRQKYKEPNQELQNRLEQLLNHIKDQYKSTKFKHLLFTITLTIENSYWKSVSSLFLIVDTLAKLYRNKKDINLQGQSNYEQINQWKNYMNCTILSIRIAILFLDIQINLCISNLINLPPNKVVAEINAFATKIQNDKQVKYDFNSFQLCDTENPELIKKSLMLSRKFYELKSIIQQKYEEAVSERRSTKSMKDQIELIKDTIDRLKLSNEDSIDVCKQYIKNCMQDVKIEELFPGQLVKYGYLLTSICKSKETVPQFQVLAHKLGVLELLSEDLKRYINLRVKEKPMERASIYWKLMLLYVLIKDNVELRREATGWRGWMIQLMCEQNQISMVAIDLLCELYHNNRNIIVSDVEEICLVCQTLIGLLQFDNKHELCTYNFLNIKINKLINFMSIFLVIEGKKIKNNYQVITNELFDKDNVIQYILKLKNIDQFSAKMKHDLDQNHISNHHIFQIMLFQLAETLEQKPEKMGFILPSLTQMLTLITTIGRKNWLLTFKIISCIHPKHINPNKFDQQHMLIRVLRSTVNTICELIIEYHYKNPAQEKYSMSKNTELVTIITHFPLLLKLTKIVLLNTFTQRKLEVSLKNIPKNATANNISIVKDKLYILQRIFLFRPYMNEQVSGRLTQLAHDNKELLGIDDCQVDFLHRLSLSHFSMEQIRQQRRLIDSVQSLSFKKRSSVHSSELRALQSSRGSARPVSDVIESQSATTSTFSINEAKQFIKSLIYINKSGSKILDTELKCFFISFLISTFPCKSDENQPAYVYSQALVVHQKTLIDFGTAELISIILQQKFRESYSLYINVFELGNKLLESGNEENQQQFLKIFKCDNKNVIFENITLIIENGLMGVKFYYYYSKNEGKGKELDVAYSSAHELQLGKEKKQVCQILKRIFRFLQLLCENDNQNLKRYVFSQVNEANVVKYMSINFIEIAINMLIQFVDIINFNLTAKIVDEAEIRANLIDVAFFILQFLIEVCQYPAIKNQVYLCNTDFFNVIQAITELKNSNSSFTKQTHKDLFAMERKIVLLLRGLLEERNPEIIEMLSKKLEVKGLTSIIKSSFWLIGVSTKLQLDEYLNTKDDRLIEEIQNVVDVLIVSKVLGLSIEDQFAHDQREILIEVNKKIREIEVNFKGQLTNIYFCYRPIFGYLSESTKSFFINKSCEHESRNQKLRDLINSRHIINQDIQNRKSRRLIMSQKGITNIFDFSVGLCFVLIGLQLFFFTVNKMGIAMDQMQTNIVQGLAVMQFIVAVIYFILWGVNISPITKEKLKEKHKHTGKQGMIEWRVYYQLVRQIYLEQSTSLHALLLLMLSFVSCFFELRLYSLVILYIFAKIELLSSILTAVRLTWGKLLIVCSLGIAFSFIFGFLSINNYIKVLYENQSIDIDIEHISSHCTTILTCIESLYTQRIIGESSSREGDSSHYGRFFSDVIYWSFFDILLTNIIAAIIIDKFAQLRNKKEKIENEKRNRCFICYADKSSIERKNEDFEQHLEFKHSIWDYFYYLYYLEKLKSHTEFTGIEYWIAKQVKSNMIDWFPLHEQSNEDYSEKKLNLMFQAFRKRLSADKEVVEEEHERPNSQRLLHYI